MLIENFILWCHFFIVHKVFIDPSLHYNEILREHSSGQEAHFLCNQWIVSFGPPPAHPPPCPGGHFQCAPNIRGANNAQVSRDGREGWNSLVVTCWVSGLTFFGPSLKMKKFALLTSIINSNILQPKIPNNCLLREQYIERKNRESIHFQIWLENAFPSWKK